MKSILGLIGIAKKGGMLAIGDEPVRAAARAGRAKSIFTACDAAGNTERRAQNLANMCKISHIRLNTDKEALGNALGMRSCAIFAVLDLGISNALIKKNNPSDF